MNGPCLNCADRKAGCHSVCEKYITYRKELDEFNAKVAEAKNREYAGIARATRIKSGKYWSKWLWVLSQMSPQIKKSHSPSIGLWEDMRDENAANFSQKTPNFLSKISHPYSVCAVVNFVDFTIRQIFALMLHDLHSCWLTQRLKEPLTTTDQFLTMKSFQIWARLQQNLGKLRFITL